MMKQCTLSLLCLLSAVFANGQSGLQDNVDDLQMESLQSAPVVMEPTETMALFQFFVTNPKGEPISSDRIRLVSTISENTYSGRPDKNGRFDLLLPKGERMELRIRALGKDSVIRILEIPVDSMLRIYNYELSYSPARTIVLENVYFDTAKTTLKPESFKSLNDLAELLRLKPEVEMEIYGHTDNVGGFDYNITLSQGRAESVKRYLIENGIAERRLTAVGFGYSRPIDTNETPEGRQKNRRTEVRILYE